MLVVQTKVNKKEDQMARIAIKYQEKNNRINTTWLHEKNRNSAMKTNLSWSSVYTLLRF